MKKPRDENTGFFVLKIKIVSYKKIDKKDFIV